MIKNEWSHTSTPPVCLHEVERDNLFCVHELYDPVCRNCDAGKVVPAHNIKAHEGGELELHKFLTSVIGKRQLSTSHIGRFTPSKTIPVKIWDFLCWDDLIKCCLRSWYLCAR